MPGEYTLNTTNETILIPGRQAGTRRKKITTWTIDNDRRDSMLELAYSLSRADNSASHQILGDWDVRSTVVAVRPMFRWQQLTGAHPPYPPYAQLPSSLSS